MGETLQLVNPRTQIWTKHFAWSPDGTLIIGLMSSPAIIWEATQGSFYSGKCKTCAHFAHTIVEVPLPN